MKSIRSKKTEVAIHHSSFVPKYRDRNSKFKIVILKSYIVNLLLTATCLLSFQLKGQDYPVQINTTLTPPYSLYLAEYTTPDRPALQVIINLKELDRSEYKVKLRLTIEGQGITLRTKPGYLPQPLILQGGLPEILTGNEISNYLNPNNLDFSGISRTDFLKRGTFPEGFYTFKIEAVDYTRDVVVSNVGLANAWLILNDPPLINLPFNNDKIVATDPQNVLFSWTPRHTASPNAAFTTEYEFKLVELYPTNRNPNDAILSSNSIYATTTSATSLNYGAAEPLLIPGRRYAFRVKAYDTEGRDLFKNNGYSETYVFQFGDACTPPININGEAIDNVRIKLMWEPGDAHTSFDFQYRREDKTEWWRENTLSDFAIIPDLSPSTTYQYQVRGRCGTLVSDFTTVNTVKTKEKNENEFECGVNTPPEFEVKTNPLSVPLRLGDMIKVNDSDVILLEITKNENGTYKGIGKTLMPMLNMAKARVKLRSVRVNEDYRVYEGKVATIYDTDGRFILNADLVKDKLNETYQGNTPQQKFEGEEITYAGDIKTIEIDAVTGNIIITREDGTGATIERPKDAAGNIKDAKITDSNGDSWVVNKDGTIQQGPSTAAPDAVASMDAINFNVTFTPNSQQNYGFDAKDENLKANYEAIKVKGEDYIVAWKAVETGRQEVVNAQTSNQNNFPNSVGFKTASGPAASQAATTTGQKQIFITGKTNDDTEALTAYVKVKEPNKEEQEVEVGRLNITTYDKILNKLYIVPVNDATAPSTQRLNEELNKIYWQAVAGWDVSVDDRFNVDPEKLKGLDDGMSGMLTSFPPKMLSLNRMFTNDPSRFVDNDAYYIFLIQGSDAKRSGFMPFKRKFGYIFLNNAGNVITAIAHELGHGAFRLYHTFSNDDYHAAESTTDNLMDYNGGTNLKKYQWDNVHSPQSLISWLKDDDESALKMAFVKGFSLHTSYYEVDGGLIPEYLWKSGTVNPIAAGFVDGMWATIEGSWGIVKFLAAWQPNNFSEEAMQIRMATWQFVLFLNDLATKPETRTQTWNALKASFSDYIDETLALDNQALYNQGKLVFDVVTLFIGVGEVKAMLSGQEVTIGIVALMQAVPKNLTKFIFKVRQLGLSIVKEADKLLIKDGAQQIALVADNALQPTLLFDAGQELVTDGSQTLVKNSQGKFGFLKKTAEDLTTFISKTLQQKLDAIANAWRAVYPEIFVERRFFEDIIGYYRYAKNAGWGHTSDIADNFKAIDFYSEFTEAGNKIYAKNAISMKTTTTKNVDTWLQSNPVKSNLDNLLEGKGINGIEWNGKTIYYNNAEVHIYMPVENITNALKTEWINKLSSLRPGIKFEINALEEFIK